MRARFFAALTELAEENPSVLLLTADLGYLVVDVFRDRFPDRFLNVGVAEQNMVGVATGLAEAGYVPFIYSITPFVVLRPYEFIRNGPVQHGLPVRIVGIGGGFEYGNDGLSHYGLEDVAVLRALPGIDIVTPADGGQVRAALLATWDRPGPVYYRLGKDDTAAVPGLGGRFEAGRVQIVREGEDILLVVMGSIAAEAVRAAERLATESIAATVAVVSCIRPAPVEDLTELLSRFGTVLTIEAHYENGGLGSLVAEVAAEHGSGCRVTRCAVRELPGGVSGSREFLYRRHGLDAESLCETALRCLQGRPRGTA